MKYLIPVICIIIIFIGCQYFQTRHLIAIGSKLASEAIPYSQIPNSPTARILIIGDSTVVGTGALDNTNSIAGRVGKLFPNATIENLGVNGAKTHELIPRLEKLKGERYDLVMVHIGGNDIVRFTDLNQLEKDIATVLDQATELGEYVTLTSCGNVGSAKLLPFGTRWVFTKRTKQVRKIFKLTAEQKNVPYVDIFREAKDDPFAKDPDTFYSADIFHPSDIGYGDWFTFIEKPLKHFSI